MDKPGYNRNFDSCGYLFETLNQSSDSRAFTITRTPYMTIRAFLDICHDQGKERLVMELTNVNRFFNIDEHYCEWEFKDDPQHMFNIPSRVGCFTNQARCMIEAYRLMATVDMKAGDMWKSRRAIFYNNSVVIHNPTSDDYAHYKICGEVDGHYTSSPADPPLEHPIVPYELPAGL